MKRTLLVGLLCCSSATTASEEVVAGRDEVFQPSSPSAIANGVDAAVAEIAKRSQPLLAPPVADAKLPASSAGDSRALYQEIKNKAVQMADQQNSIAQMVADTSRANAATEATAKSVGAIYNGVNAKSLKAMMGANKSGDSSVDPAKTVGLLFLSMSMPDKDVSSALEMASEYGVRVVFIGLPKGARNIPDAMRVMKKIAVEAKLKPEQEPDVGIDPNAFAKYGVRVVPTLVRETGDGHFHRLEGSINWRYFDDTIKGLEQGKWLNQQAGQTWQIEETSLIEEMKRRMASIDWEEKKKAAINRFWTNQKMNRLPAAVKTERWMIDPTVRVTKDMYDRGGKLIAKAGTQLNPLAGAHVPLRMLVINPASQRELKWAMQYQQKNPFGGQTMILGTDFTENGWKVMEKASNTLQARIRLAPSELITRFRLTATPAVVETINSAFGVQQFAIEQEIAQ